MNTPDVLNKGITEMYAARNFTAGPATYTSQDFLQKICDAAGLNRTSRSIRVLDSMSGPGLLGIGLQKLAPQHRYFYLDLVESQLQKVSNATGRITGDARFLPFGRETIRTGVIRYAAKDIPEEQQFGLFQEMYRVTARGGRWILADMYAPIVGNVVQNGQIYEWLNFQHAMKQERSGRNRAAEGVCHIPTEEGWIKLFTKAGFRDIQITDHHMSYVTTSDWVKGGQFPKEHEEKSLAELNHTILTAPTIAKKAFNIREENGSVKIDYPVTIIRAVKP